MTWLTFNYATFIQYYVEFNNPATWPEATLQLYWNEATTYISNDTTQTTLTQAQLYRAVNLMTAHLARLNSVAATGGSTQLVQGSTVDKVSVQLTPPPERNQWQWWLNQTPYGQMLLALLQVQAVGGFFVGCYPTQSTIPR